MNVVVLRVEGLGHVPSFKNNKMLCRGRLITDPKKQKWMKRCEDSFVWQLYCHIPTKGAGTLMEPRQLSLIASSTPEDDSWTCIPEITVKAIRCPKGQEGADIRIEPI